MSENLLEIKELKVEFPGKENFFTAVDGISFSLQRGETLGIVGESGSGKSITALSIMGLLPGQGRITTGEIRFKGQGQVMPVDLLQLDPETRRSYRGNRLAMIFQEPMTSLNPVFTCGRQVAESLEIHQKMDAKRAMERTIELFEQVKLTDASRITGAYPHQLSGGQRQRVMIAMALAAHPDILIADEPTTALDVTVQSAILGLFRDLKAAFGSSVVFISHDLGVIAELADRVLIMRHGRIVESGAVESVFSNPQHPYTKALLACRPPLDRRLRQLPTVDLFDTPDQNDLKDRIRLFEMPDQDLATRKTFLASQPVLLEARELKVRFPVASSWISGVKTWVNAVDGVDLYIKKGECLGLVGESGSGKTTLGRTILGLQPAVSGTISYDGQLIDPKDELQWKSLRSDMQIIFQDPYGSLNPKMPVGDAIAEPMSVHFPGLSKKEIKEKVAILMTKTGLPADYYYRYPFQLSGGQRQRVCIARALAVEPKFMVCDEPVSALDVSIQAQILNLLAGLKEDFNLTYLFISHDLSVVKFISDRMMVVQNGKIVEQGDPEALYQNPTHPYTQKLIEAIPKKINYF